MPHSQPGHQNSLRQPKTWSTTPCTETQPHPQPHPRRRGHRLHRQNSQNPPRPKYPHTGIPIHQRRMARRNKNTRRIQQPPRTHIPQNHHQMAPQQDRIPHQRPRMQPHNMGRQHHTNRQQLHRTTTNDQRPHPRHHGRRILLEGRRNTGRRRPIRQTRRHRNLDLRQRRPPPTRNPSRQIRPHPPRNTTTPHRQHPPKHRTPTTQSRSNILETLSPNQKQRRQCQIQTQTMDLNRHEVSNVRLRILAPGRNNPHKNKIMGIVSRRTFQCRAFQCRPRVCAAYFACPSCLFLLLVLIFQRASCAA